MNSLLIHKVAAGDDQIECYLATTPEAYKTLIDSGLDVTELGTDGRTEWLAPDGTQFIAEFTLGALMFSPGGVS